MKDIDRERDAVGELIFEAERFIGPLTSKETRRAFLGCLAMEKYCGGAIKNTAFVYALWGAIKNTGKVSFVEMCRAIGEFEGSNLLVDKCRQTSGEFPKFRDAGIPSGLIHGHFRYLTLGHMTMLIEAKRVLGENGKLLVLLESGERTRKFKGAEPLMTDEQRASALLFSGLTDSAGVIVNIDRYDDSFYRSEVSKFKPSFYFGTNNLSDERKAEYCERAKLVGAKPVFLYYHQGVSTTRLLECFS